MTSRRYLFVVTIFIVTWNIWAIFTAAEQTPFTHLWQLWHPLSFTLVGGALIIPMLVYGVRVAHRWGGRSSAIGRGILWMLLGVGCWLPVGVFVFYWYTTCAIWPVLGCSYPIGYEPLLSWSTPWFNVMYPAFAVGLWNLASLVGLAGRQLVRLWWVPALVLTVDIVAATPLGAGFIVDHWDGSTAQTVAMGALLGNVAILSGGLILAINARHAAAGMFHRPLWTLVAALALLTVGDWVSAARVRAGADLGGLTVPVYSASMLLIVLSLTMFGQVVEAQMPRAVVRSDD